MPRISWSEERRGFLVTRHADLVTCLQRHALSSSITPNTLVGVTPAVYETYAAVLRRQLDLMDPPRHTRIRHVFSQAFDSAQLERSRAFVKQWVRSRVSRLPPSFDLVREIALPLPLAVVLDFLGLPADLQTPLHRGVAQFVAALADPVAFNAPASAALDSLRGVLSTALERTDLTEGGLLTILRDTESLDIDFEDVVAGTILTVAAGHQTTTNLIGNGAWLLLTHPSERSRVGADPLGWSVAIEEMLRFESPVQTVRRVATEAFEIAGQRIEAGHELVLAIGLANRDLEAFVDPDRFDVRRSPNRHLAFGFGAHFCLGAPLAKLQAHTALEALFSLRSLRAVDPEPAWIPSSAYRGLERLIVEWTP